MAFPFPRAAGAGRVGAVAALISSMLALAACAPALDWRDVRPAGSRLLLLMPCKPVAQQRDLALAGARTRLELNACSADGQTWALAHADVQDPARVGPALAELRRAVGANTDGAGAMTLPLQVAGATPQPASQRARFDGRLPDGKAVQVQVAVFAHGTRVFQATALGPRLPDEAVQTFFGSLRFEP